MDWRNLRTPQKGDNKLSDSQISSELDQKPQKKVYTKNKSLHERTQSTEFKALFNQYLKKKKSSIEKIDQQKIEQQQKIQYELQKNQQFQPQNQMIKNYRNLELKSEKFEQKKHQFLQTKPFNPNNLMQNLSDLENKDTIPNNKQIENTDTLQIYQFLQKLQTDVNEIKHNMNNNKKLMSKIQQNQDNSNRTSSLYEKSEFQQQIKAEIHRELSTVIQQFFQKDHSEIQEKIAYKLDLLQQFHQKLEQLES